MSARVPAIAGWVFVIVGLATWNVLLWRFGLPDQTLVSVGPRTRWSLEATVIPVPFRHAAFALGVAGLLLLARSFGRGVPAAFVAAAGWLLGEFVLLLAEPSGPARGVLAAVVTAGVLAVAAYCGHGVTQPARAAREAWWPFVVAAALTPFALDPLGLRVLVGIPAPARPLAAALLVLVPLAVLALASAARPAARDRWAWGLAGTFVVLAAAATMAGWATALGRDPQAAFGSIVDFAGMFRDSLLVAACAALAGVLGAGWRAVRRAVAVAGLVAIASAAGQFTFTIGNRYYAPDVDTLWITHRPLWTTVVLGLFAGLMAFALARLLAAPWPAAPPAEWSGWRGAVGGVLLAAGVAAWSLFVALVEPAARDRFPDHPASNNAGILLVWAKELRWSAIALAVGGLLVIGLRRQRLLLGMVAWVALDVGLDLADVGGQPLAFGVFAAVTIGWLALVRGHAGAPPGRGTVFYSGAAPAMGLFPLYVVAGSDGLAGAPVPLIATELPSFAVPVAGVVSGLLGVAGVCAALATAPRVGAARWLVAAMAVAMHAAAVLVGYLREDLLLVGLFGVAGLVVCVLLSGAGSARFRVWWAWLLVPLAAPIAFFGAFTLADRARYLVMAATGSPAFGDDAWLMGTAAALTAAVLVLVAQLPRALSAPAP